MSWGVLALVAAAAALVAIYALIARGLLSLGAPAQRRALALAQQLAARPDLSPEARRTLDVCVFAVDKAWVAWILAICMIPLSVIGAFVQFSGSDQLRGMSKDTLKLYLEFNVLALIGTLVNSPFAFFLALIEMTVLIGLTGSTLLLGGAVGKIASIFDRLAKTVHAVSGH